MSELPGKKFGDLDLTNEKGTAWNKTRATMPEWEDLSEEQKAQYGSPMKYARKRLEGQISSARDVQNDAQNEGKGE